MASDTSVDLQEPDELSAKPRSEHYLKCSAAADMHRKPVSLPCTDVAHCLEATGTASAMGTKHLSSLSCCVIMYAATVAACRGYGQQSTTTRELAQYLLQILWLHEQTQVHHAHT